MLSDQAASDPLTYLMYVNNILMLNALLRQARIPLYIHLDNEQQQLQVFPDDGSVLQDKHVPLHVFPVDMTGATVEHDTG